MSKTEVPLEDGNADDAFLRFEEKPHASKKSARQRIFDLSPQIKHYRSQNIRWNFILEALSNIGINLSEQSIKNAVSASPNKAVYRYTHTFSSIRIKPHLE